MNSNDPMAWLRQFQAAQPWLQAASSGFGQPAATGWPGVAAMPWLAMPPSMPAFAGAFPGFAGFSGSQAAAGDDAGGGTSEVMARLLTQGRRYLELLQGLALPSLLDGDGRFDAGQWLDGLKQMHAQYGQGLSGAPSLPWFGGGDASVMEGMVRSLVASLGAGVRNEAEAWLGLPTFGPAREHHERIQGLLRAWLDYQAANARHAELMHGSATRTLEVLEDRLADRDAKAEPLTTPRALYDLLIDAAEEAFAELAMSADFARLSGELTNAQMRVRAAVNTEIELMAAQFGLPTRTEVDSLGRKVQALSRELRRRDAGALATAKPAVDAGTGAETATGSAGKAAARPARKSAAKTAAKTTAKTATRPSRATAKPAASAARAARKTATKAATKAASRTVKKTGAATTTRSTAKKASAASKAGSRTATRSATQAAAAGAKAGTGRSTRTSAAKAASKRTGTRSTRKAPVPVLRSTQAKG